MREKIEVKLPRYCGFIFRTLLLKCTGFLKKSQDFEFEQIIEGMFLNSFKCEIL